MIRGKSLIADSNPYPSIDLGMARPVALAPSSVLPQELLDLRVGILGILEATASQLNLGSGVFIRLPITRSSSFRLSFL